VPRAPNIQSMQDSLRANLLHYKRGERGGLLTLFYQESADKGETVKKGGNLISILIGGEGSNIEEAGGT